MDNQLPQKKGVTENTKQTVLVAISTDTLMYMKSRTESGALLINGNDTNAFLIEGEIRPMLKIIDRCFQARQENSPVKFSIDGHTIIFK